MKILRSFLIVSVFMLATAVMAAAQTSLAALDGGTVNVEGQKGKVVILAVGASWLPLSEQQSDVANALAKKYADRNVVVYFVATDSTRAGSRNFASDDAIRKFAFSKKIGVTVLRDPDGQATLKRFKMEQVPSFVIIDRNGAMVGVPIGGIDPKGDTTDRISKIIDKVI